MVKYRNKKTRACLFDMDNTLYNFVDAKKAACQKAVDIIGSGMGDDLFRYFLRGIHGFEDQNNIKDYMNDTGTWNERTFRDACLAYETIKLEKIEPYPGVPHILSLLKARGIRMAVVTDAGTGHAHARLNKAGLTLFFDCIVTPDISGKRKPQPDSFLMALDILGVKPQEAWIVGDSLRREVAPGNHLGMTTIHARYGDWVGVPAPSIKPDYILEEFKELPRIMGIEKGFTFK